MQVYPHENSRSQSWQTFGFSSATISKLLFNCKILTLTCMFLFENNGVKNLKLW